MKIAIFAINSDFLGKIRTELSQHHQIREFQSTGNDIFNLANINRLIDWCDVIFCDFLQYPANVITTLESVDKPIVVRAHGIDLFKDFDGDFDAIHTLIVSPVAKRIFLQMLSAKQRSAHIKNILEVAPGCDIDFFQFSPEKAQSNFGKNIVMQSTFMRTEKRIYTGIQLFKELLDIDSSWFLHIVSDWFSGAKDVRQERYAWSIQELVDDLKLRDNIKVYKFMPKERWRDFLMTKDVFWSLSTAETFSSSLMEAMATGIYPVISCWFGANMYYPDSLIHNHLGDIIHATVQWSEKTPEEKLKEAQALRNIATIYDEKKIVVRIREAIENVGK
jgi:glycosyltransferase involved in cell wall biosynthesis